MVMASPTNFHFKLPPYQGAPLGAPVSAPFPGVDAHVGKCSSERTFRGDGKIRAIVIHATEGGSSSGAITRLFSHEASWHWLVPDEDEHEHESLVWRCVPESRAAWHVLNSCSHPDVFNNSRNTNYWSIGIEIVNSMGADRFSDWQVEQTAALVRSAWSRYPDLVDVVSHAKLDPARRSDPGALFPWDRFRELVLSAPPPLPRALVAASVEPRTDSIHVIGLSGERIDCDARFLDGVTVGEIGPLVEALGFGLEIDRGSPMRLRVVNARTAPRPAARRKPRAKAKKKTTSPRGR